MNILVVDDEQFVRCSLTETIREASSEYCIVGEAKNGEEAIQIVQNANVELIITDIRMPKVDGMELCKRVHEYDSSIKIVLLSGYADFLYAQQAIKYGVSDYLIKPCDSTEILQCIAKLTLEVQHRKYQLQLEKLHSNNILEKHLDDLLYGIPIPHFDQAILPSFSYIVMISLGLNQPLTATNWGDLDALKAVKNVAEEWLKPYGQAIGIVEEDHLALYLFLQSAIEPMDLEETAKKLSLILKDNLKFKVNIGITLPVSKLSDIPRCYRESYQALQNSLKDEDRIICSFHSEESLHNATYSDEEEISVKGRRRVISHLMNQMEQRCADNLSLKQLSEEVYLNPTYLGRIFKDDTGYSFNYYLNMVRIEKAKQLLDDFRVKVYEVCDKVGFKDPAYFSQTFKKYTGMTPQEYQKMLHL